MLQFRDNEFGVLSSTVKLAGGGDTVKSKKKKKQDTDLTLFLITCTNMLLYINSSRYFAYTFYYQLKTIKEDYILTDSRLMILENDQLGEFGS